MKSFSKLNIAISLIFLVAIISSIALVGGNFNIVWLPTIVFSALFLASTLRDVLITEGDEEVGAAATPALIVGAAVVFHGYNTPLAFILCILITGFYLPNIKKREWSKLTFNVSNDVIGGALCYAVLSVFAFSVNEPIYLFVLTVFLAAAAYVVVNYSLLSVVFAAAGINWREALYDARNSLLEVLPLAIFAGILGKFYFDFGTAMLFMFVIPLFFGRELHASYARMAETQKAAIDTLITALEAKDKYTAGHVDRVAKFAKYIGAELGYGPRRLERVRQAALLHDIGKLIVPSALLNKPGKLTEEEFKIIQRHEFVTIEILRSIDFLSSIAITAGGDHNKMKDDAASTRKLEPYIVSVCDAFDAMTSSRSYRKALPMEVAYEELQSKKGKQFHPKVVEALINAIDKKGEKYGDGYETDIVHADAPEAGIGSAGIGDLESDGAPSETTTEPAPANTEPQSQVARTKVQGDTSAKPATSN